MSEKPPAYEPPQAGYPPPAGDPGAYPPPHGQPGAYPPPQGQPGAYPPPQGQPGAYPPPAAGYPPPAGAYPPPPPGQPGAYAPQHGKPATTVVVTSPMAGPMPGSTIRYGQAPALIVCQHCQATVTTTLDYEPGLLTWASVGFICLFGCWLGCCLIPFCIDALKDVRHRCPNCNNVVGQFRHFS